MEMNLANALQVIEGKRFMVSTSNGDEVIHVEVSELGTYTYEVEVVDMWVNSVGSVGIEIDFDDYEHRTELVKEERVKVLEEERLKIVSELVGLKDNSYSLDRLVEINKELEAL